MKPKRLRRIMAATAVLGIGFGAAVCSARNKDRRPLTPGAAAAPLPAAPGTSPNFAQARQAELAAQDAGKPGDPELEKQYQEINRRYFANRLPAIPVLWEPQLEEVGPLIARGYVMQGLASSNPQLILLNPRNRARPVELRRVLCHEMVHVYLYSVQDLYVHHGPAFQREMSRLLRAGAYQRVSSSGGAKSRLRSWLQAQSGRLSAHSAEIDKRDAELDQVQAGIDRQRARLVQQHQDLNQRIARANQEQKDWPSDEEIDACKAGFRDLNRRILRFQQSVAGFNADVAGYNAEVQRFNREVRRYNLMTAYPDGLDENSNISAKGEASVRR